MRISNCLHPKYVKNPYTGISMNVPCGECEACKLQKGSVWSNRLIEEFKFWKYAVFFTLTYQDDYLPRLEYVSTLNEDDSPDLYIHSLDLDTNTNKSFKFFKDVTNSSFFRYQFDKFGFIPVLSRSDASKFIKVFRQKFHEAVGHTNFSWFICGEYGPTTYRPHFHGIIFFNDSCFNQTEDMSCSITSCINVSWSNMVRDKSKDFRFSLGFTDVQGVARNSKAGFRYVSNYLNLNAHLPSVLCLKEISQFHRSSHSRPIGVEDVPLTSLSELFYCGIVERICYDDVKREYNLQLYPRNYRGRVFPEHRGFDKIDSWCFEQWLNVVSECSNFESFLNHDTFISDYTLYFFVEFVDNIEVMLPRYKLLYYSLKKVLKVCTELGCPRWDYSYYYRQYKSKMELYQLRQFYELQQELCDDIRFDRRFLNCLYYFDKDSYSFLPYQGDNYAFYCELNNCPQFVSDALKSHKISLDTTKTKKRNSYFSKNNYQNNKFYLNL